MVVAVGDGAPQEHPLEVTRAGVELSAGDIVAVRNPEATICHRVERKTQIIGACDVERFWQSLYQAASYPAVAGAVGEESCGVECVASVVGGLTIGGEK